MSIPLSSSEIQHIASVTAEEAVRKTLLVMGVDVSDPKSIQEMQYDMAHVRRWRKSVETVQRQSLIAAIGVIVSGIAAAIWMAISLKGHA